MRNVKIKFFVSFLVAVVFGLGLSANANAQAQKLKAAFNKEQATDQPLYEQYKGVRLGMSADEARAKLGTPTLKDNDQDFYMFSENESAQIGYDAAHDKIVNDMMREGIVDPLKVTRLALENAVSVAAMFLTTEAAIAELPKKEEKAMPQMPHDDY